MRGFSDGNGCKHAGKRSGPHLKCSKLDKAFAAPVSIMRWLSRPAARDPGNITPLGIRGGGETFAAVGTRESLNGRRDMIEYLSYIGAIHMISVA